MKTILFFFLFTFFVACKEPAAPAQPITSNILTDSLPVDSAIPVISNAGPGLSRAEDSAALLLLTKKLYQWQEERTGGDFEPLPQKTNDTVYSAPDILHHKRRILELKNTGFFSEAFISNYNNIFKEITNAVKTGDLVWNVGELPPYGTGANPWCECQDVPDNFVNKIWISNLTITDSVASFNWSWGGGLVYHLKTVKQGETWKILYMEGFDFESFLRSFQRSNTFTGNWENGMVRLNIGDSSLAFLYHTQCVYFYPVHKINNIEFEMIWADDMDCKFDNGTHRSFGLQKIPQKGKPFAKFKLEKNVLTATYYYPEWVKKYTNNVATEVFTDNYYRAKSY